METYIVGRDNLSVPCNIPNHIKVTVVHGSYAPYKSAFFCRGGFPCTLAYKVCLHSEYYTVYLLLRVSYTYLFPVFLLILCDNLYFSSALQINLLLSPCLLPPLESVFPLMKQI